MNSSAAVTEQEILLALEKVAQIVSASGNNQDLTYFTFHKKRFLRMAKTITKQCKPGQKVLDMGSHYLHSSLLLSFLGYQVHSMDVQAFWNIEMVQERASEFGLFPVVENNLETLESCSGKTEDYDVILFTEILEHITFNPVNFWKNIYRILRNQGIIYITTPNSLTLYSIFRTMFRMIQLKGIGLDTESIFSQVTYGHHWKEYSAFEIRKYFTALCDGFQVSIDKYFYKTYPTHNLKSIARYLLVYLSNRLPFFRGEIEAVITLKKPADWKVEPPGYC